jgi:hypothetical protein
MRAGAAEPACARVAFLMSEAISGVVRRACAGQDGDSFMVPRLRSAGLVVLAAACFLLAACADLRTDVDSEVVNSIRYDTVPCAQLMAERDSLVRTYGSPAGLAPDQQPGIRPILKEQSMGIFPLPEYRSRKVREEKIAFGRIEAMDRSIDRRACGKPQPKKNGPL